MISTVSPSRKKKAGVILATSYLIAHRVSRGHRLAVFYGLLFEAQEELLSHRNLYEHCTAVPEMEDLSEELKQPNNRIQASVVIAEEAGL